MLIRIAFFSFPFVRAYSLVLQCFYPFLPLVSPFLLTGPDEWVILIPPLTPLPTYFRPLLSVPPLNLRPNEREAQQTQGVGTIKWEKEERMKKKKNRGNDQSRQAGRPYDRYIGGKESMCLRNT